MTGSLVPLAFQWSLNETADGFYKISKDIVRAASADNVQTIALDALDKFGSTLAICSETEYRVEQGLRQLRGSSYINFLKARIGFVTGDSCNALSQSTGGIRFLSLAATLATWEPLDAAKATREMLKASSRTDQFLPTLGQLLDVYQALEYKTHRLGFADEILRWHARIVEGKLEQARQKLRDLHQKQNRPDATSAGSTPGLLREQQNRVYADIHPGPSVLAELVDAFREVHRLGQGSYVRITIEYGAVWVIAFCEWCVGTSPKIIDPNTGWIFQDDPTGQSGVLIELDQVSFAKSPTKIEVSTVIGSPSRLWKLNQPSIGGSEVFWGGMVSLEHYGKRYIEECELETGLGSRALSQALVHSTTTVLSCLPLLHNNIHRENNTSTGSLTRLDTDLNTISRRVTRTISRYLGIKNEQAYTLRELKDGKQIEDLEIVDLHINALRKQCLCPTCSSDPSSYLSCLVHNFQYYVSHITAQILAVSLFELTEQVKLFFSASSLPHQTPQCASLIVKTIEILFPDSEVGRKLPKLMSVRDNRNATGERAVDLTDLFDLGLYMIGHKANSKDSWVASAQRG